MNIPVHRPNTRKLVACVARVYYSHYIYTRHNYSHYVCNRLQTLRQMVYSYKFLKQIRVARYAVCVRKPSIDFKLYHEKNTVDN